MDDLSYSIRIFPVYFVCKSDRKEDLQKRREFPCMEK